MTFHPIGKVVNVVRVDNIADGVNFANPATQTVGVWPPERKSEVRDRLCAAGVQRVIRLSEGDKMFPGLPHDGFCRCSGSFIGSRTRVEIALRVN